MKAQIETVPISQILLRDRIAKPTAAEIEQVRRSIEKTGLINPPGVNRNGYLIHGYTRYRAACMLGWVEMQVIRYDVDDEDIETLMEADENLARRDVSAAEKALLYQSYREAWGRLSGEGEKKKAQKPTQAEIETSVRKKVKEDTGMSDSTISRLAALTALWSREQLAALKGCPLNGTTILLKVGRLPEPLKTEVYEVMIRAKPRTWPALLAVMKDKALSVPLPQRPAYEPLLGPLLPLPTEAVREAKKSGAPVVASDGESYGGDEGEFARAALAEAVGLIAASDPDDLVGCGASDEDLAKAAGVLSSAEFARADIVGDDGLP